MSDRVSLMAELRQKYPGRGRKADHEGSRASAIAPFCLQCMGGASRADVADCRAFECPLWPYRPYGETTRPEGIVPTLEEYRALGEGRGHGEALAQWRNDAEGEVAGE